MRWFIIAMFLFSTFLLFTSLLQIFFLSDKRMQKRLKHYLNQSEKKGFDRKSFNMALQIRLTTQKIKHRVLTKEKNNKLETFLNRAGVSIKPEEYVLIQWMATALGGALFFLITGNLFLSILGGVLGFLVPKWVVSKKQRDRMHAFNEGLPDMITTVVGALRAGFSFPQSLKTVVEESQSPIKEEIETVLREMQYGSKMEESLYALKERMPSDDLDLMIQAIVIQRQVGGNLATVLEQIVDTIRERTKVHRQIRTLTAQGRLSGIVIGLLPVILAFVIYVIEPNYIGTLFNDPIGIALVAAGVISGCLGFFLIRKLTTIEV